MGKILSALVSLFLVCSSALAEVKDVPPPESVDVTGIAIFGALFFGLCIYFVWFVWRAEKKRRLEGKQTPQP
jgi:hypothetical protein